MDKSIFEMHHVTFEDESIHGTSGSPAPRGFSSYAALRFIHARHRQAGLGQTIKNNDVTLGMKILKVNIPDTVDFDDKEALMAIASRLYEKGKLSVGQAAELVGLSKSAFMEILSNYGVSVFNYPSSDLDRDVENAKGYNI